MIAPIMHRFTESEYLAMEQAASERHEYFNGQIFAMAGGTAKHSVIKVNVCSELRRRLGRQCTVFDSDMLIKVEETGLLTYPDASVVCGKTAFEDETELVLVNPVLLIEVTSPSSVGYDHGDKWLHYQQIPTLHEYLLISQSEPKVEQYVRQDDGSWKYRTYIGLETVIPIETAGCELPMSELYAGVEFPKEVPLH